ncbi:MAG: DUF3575 domain-containing protein [Flavobacteriaceae bacterium]|jgi:hypothetical protein|nr:DUF3575 domain-containing protein [Flavobacteriaceae bacterium]
MKRKLSFLALAAAFSLPCKAQESSVEVKVENVKQSKVAIMASAGYAWRTAEIPSGTAYFLKNHLEKLTSGFHFDISAYHRIAPNMGLGLKFNRYSASAQTSLGAAYFSTKDRIIFIGPSFMYSTFDMDTPHKFYWDVAIGYLQYTSDSFVNVRKIEAKGSTIGLYSTIGYQYAVNRSFLIGPQLGFGLGALKSYTENGVSKSLGKNEKEGLGRVSLAATATIRF